MKKRIYLFFLIFIISCKSKKVDVVLTENEMYYSAIGDFNNKIYKLAGDNFRKVGEQFIFTPIATKSIIMSIYSYYKAKNYNDSLELIEYYKKINFETEYIDYILYMEILNKYKKAEKSWKDLKLLNDLLNDINLLALRDTKYRNDILKKRKVIIEKIVINELKIYEFYVNKNNLIGAINHLKNIIENYPENKYTARVIYELSILYKHINYKDGYNECINILEKNYKKTKWYKNAI